NGFICKCLETYGRSQLSAIVFNAISENAVDPHPETRFLTKSIIADGEERRRQDLNRHVLDITWPNTVASSNSRTESLKAPNEICLDLGVASANAVDEDAIVEDVCRPRHTAPGRRVAGTGSSDRQTAGFQR